MKVILAVNTGSSSVKVSVYLAAKNTIPQQIAALQVKGITTPSLKLQYSRSGKTLAQGKIIENVQSHGHAFRLLLDILVEDTELQEMTSKLDITIICHRIVHGGSYSEAQIITAPAYRQLERLSGLAPIHNGVALSVIDICATKLPNAINVACFDTQFHRTIPAHIYTYPIRQDMAEMNGLRKYGFHGISYAFISRSVAEFLHTDLDKLNIIALHLGSGASACAVKGGKSWDTSMGLTPLSGLPGATRSGSIDPSLIFHYASDVGRHSPKSTQMLPLSKAEDILNNESGWESLTGTADFSVIASSYEPQHMLAFDLLVDRICGFVGSYYVSLQGQVDALVFAGGIGEKSARLRSAVVQSTNCLGFALDEFCNSRETDMAGEVVRDVSLQGTQARVLICKTDEQYEMISTCTAKEELWS